MDQGRQGRDQVDTAVVQDVRGQRRAAPTSCARLQSWQLSPHACNTGANQGLVADELEGEADQDRREGGEPRTLCRLPNGGGRHPTTNVPGDSAADRGTTAAATTRASMKRSIVTRSSAIDRRNASPSENSQINPSTIVRAARAAGSQPYLPSGFQGRCKIATLHAGFGVIRGMSAQFETSGFSQPFWPRARQRNCTPIHHRDLRGLRDKWSRGCEKSDDRIVGCRLTNSSRLRDRTCEQFVSRYLSPAAVNFQNRE